MEFKCLKCGGKTVKVVVDVIRKEDRKVAEDVTAKHCVPCNAYFIDFEVITFE